jgi:hypothetical protein
MANFDISDIIAEYGSYYLNNGQNLRRLKAAMTTLPSTLAIPGVQNIMTEETVYQMANPIMSSVLQSFQLKFTDKGAAKFHANEIRLRHVKIDNAFYPHEIEASWLGFLKGNSSANLQDWPIVRYILEQLILSKAAEEKELSAVYNGIYAAPTDGTASEATTIFDGLHKACQNAAADTDYPCITVTTGDLAEASIVDQMEAIVDAVNNAGYANLKFYAFVAPEMETAYLRKVRDLGSYTISTDKQVENRIDFSNVVIKGVPSMTGTKHCFATTGDNIVHLTTRDMSKSNCDIQKADRQVKVLMDWWEGLGFGCNQMVIATDKTVATA